MRYDTKKVFFYDETGEIVESFETRRESPIDHAKVLVVNDIPKYTPRNGFYGKMVVRDGKLDFDYLPIDPDRDLTPEQLAQVFEEVM